MDRVERLLAAPEEVFLPEDFFTLVDRVELRLTELLLLLFGRCTCEDLELRDGVVADRFTRLLPLRVLTRFVLRWLWVLTLP